MSTAALDIILGSKGGDAVQRTIQGIKGSFIDLSAKIFVAEQAIVRIWGLASKGAQFEETLGRLNRQMGAFNSTGQLMVNTLQSISQGTLGVDNAATMASRALAVGLDPTQIETFTQAAMLLKNVMGTELPGAFDEIVSAAISGRAAVLGNIGVYVDLDEEVKRLAVSTNRTTDQITKQEKAMLTAKAVTAQIGEATRRLSDGMLSDADRLKQVEERWDALWLSIGRNAKEATIAVLDFGSATATSFTSSFQAIQDWMDAHPTIKKLLFGRMGPTPQDDAVWQEVLGRAIVSNAQGNFGKQPDRRTEPPKPMPTGLRGGQLEAEFARQDKVLQGELDRTKAMLQAKQQLLDTDVQLQIRTAEDVVTAKGALSLQELAKQAETLNVQLAREDAFFRQRKTIGFDSTEERISEETRHAEKVVEINQALQTTVQALGMQSDKNEAERAIARGTAEQQLGSRLTEQFKSSFDIKESLRQQDLDDAQTYYQGELDMATARFAGDQEIAGKERQLLREQLAFKLRLTQEEVDRLLFLRKAGDFEGVRQITGRADPSLNPRAVEGIVESATSKDILAAERANGDFFAGWSRGLQKYAQDRDSAFGMSADMARRSAQTMEQGFQTFFFDSMDGKFKSFKDVLTGVLDFTKQIISQMMAQMVTVGLIKPGANALMNIFGGGGAATSAVGAGNYASTDFFSGKFASGGSFMVGGSGGTDTTPVSFMATRGERVTVSTPGQQAGAALAITMPVTIINQVDGAKVETRQSTGAGGMPQLEVLITKMINKAVGEGRMDQPLRTRFGLTPGER